MRHFTDNDVVSFYQPLQVHTGLLQMQLDPKAERVLAIDRATLEPVFKLRAATNINKLVDYKYTIDANLMIVLIDDTNEHDAECADFVKAEAIELTTHVFA